MERQRSTQNPSYRKKKKHQIGRKTIEEKEI
jgi:hypothetical protein